MEILSKDNRACNEAILNMLHFKNIKIRKREVKAGNKFKVKRLKEVMRANEVTRKMEVRQTKIIRK